MEVYDDLESLGLAPAAKERFGETTTKERKKERNNIRYGFRPTSTDAAISRDVVPIARSSTNASLCCSGSSLC